MNKTKTLIIPVCLLGGLVILPSLKADTSFSYDGFTVVQQSPGSTATTVTGTTTETFNEFSASSGGTAVTSLSVLGGAGTLTKGSLFTADQYGGAGGGNFYNVGSQNSVGPSTAPGTLKFNNPQTFFGMWWSAADNLNKLQFYSGTTLLATFVSSEPGSVLGANDITQGLSDSYKGNPSGSYSGDDKGEYFVYLDFTDNNASMPITSVVFSDGNESTGFEMDNFSILTCNTVPDMPGTLSLLGLAFTGLAACGRRFRK